MASSDITFPILFEKFGIEQQSALVFDPKNIKSISPSARLRQDIKDGQLMPLYSEKAKSEALIYPIIREIKNRNPQISVFSGYTFNVNGILSGAPDFMIAAKPNMIEPQRPIFCMIESKNKAPDEGYAQCAAEMYAAKCFNEQMNEPVEVIYGAVTNAFEWVFLKLENNTIYVDTQRHYLNELPKLLGIFQHIIAQI